MNGKQTRLEIVIEYVMILFGTVLASFALDVFMIPNGIIDGGITGISIMISTITGIKLSMLLLVINAPFFILGYTQLGKRFLIRVTFAMACFCSLLEIMQLVPPIKVDTILAAGAGGALLGIGVGFIIRYGGCLDGTETIAILLSRKTEWSVGQVVMLANLIIYSISSLMFGWDRALYSMSAYLFSYGLIDKVAEGMQHGKAMLAVTKNASTLVESIYKRLGRTVTFWGVEGYVNGEQKMVYSVVTRMEISELKRIIDEDENSSFVAILDVSEIVGNHVKKTKQNMLKERRDARIESGNLLKVEED